MPALPLWSVIVVVLSVASIIIGLLFCLFRCRRFPRSTVDPAEYTDKKQGFHPVVSEAISNSTQEKTICPTTTTTTTSNSQPFTPTTTTTSSSSSSSSPSSPSSPSPTSCSIPPSSAHAYSGEPLSEKHHEFDDPKEAAPTNHHQEDQKNDNFHISLPLPPPSTSFFADKMELNSDEATRMFESYMSSSNKKNHPNQGDFVSVDLTSTNHPEDHKAAFYDTINHLQHKATATIRSTLRQSLRRQKSSTKKTTIQQLFDSVIVSADGDKDNFGDDYLSSSCPPLDPKSALTPLTDVSPPSPPPTSKSNDSSDSSSSIREDKPSITLSSSPFHQLDEEADHQNSSNRTSLTTPRVSAEVSFGVDSTRSAKGRHLLDYNLDTMFAWPSGDSEEDDDGDDESDDYKRGAEDDHRISIDSVLHSDNNDKVSITSGSVHRLVRDSTVVDTDHRSLAARSISNSVRPSLHEMASWWSNDNDNESIDQHSVSNTNQEKVQDPQVPSDSSLANDPPQNSLITTTTANNHKINHQPLSTSISKAMASYSSSSPTSTFSRATLNKFRDALANEESESDEDQDDNDEPDKLQQPLVPEPQRIVEESSIKYAVPDNELTPITIPTFTEVDTELPPSTSSSASPSVSPSSSSTATPSPSPPSSPCTNTYESDSEKSSIKSRPVSISNTISSQFQREVIPSSPVAAVASIRSNARNSTIVVGGSSNNNNVDSVRRVLQGTWNTHRFSDQGSIASSTRSNLSQGMSPPGSVNPRQLNQHLASLSLQSNGGRHHIRPGLPTGFMNEDLLVPGPGGTMMGPQPTVSFSSSTVRTMIPENEPIERHVGQKKTAAQQQQQKQKVAPKQKQKKEPMVKSTTPAAAVTVKDQKQQQQNFGTMRTGRQQRGTMPWNADASTKSKPGDKTPAQRERDRYLQSLKG